MFGCLSFFPDFDDLVMDSPQFWIYLYNIRVVGAAVEQVASTESQ
jgi:hypothetical protein